MDADRKRDILRNTILELISKECVHYTELDKKVCATCYPFATTNTFKSQLQYLLSNNFINRVTRGIYQLTPKGEKYMDLLRY